MKINNMWVLEKWGKNEGENIMRSEETIELRSNILYELNVEYFNLKVKIFFFFLDTFNFFFFDNFKFFSLFFL